MLLFATAEDDRNKVVSAAAQVEARSAVCRLRKAKSITPAEATMAIDAIAAESRRMVEQPINQQVIEAANILVDRHHLRAMDAIQLGSAIVARDLLAAPTMRFIVSDVELKAAARAEGFGTWDPTD
jgi:predicted nucleic acid-binding protein